MRDADLLILCVFVLAAIPGPFGCRDAGGPGQAVRAERRFTTMSTDGQVVVYADRRARAESATDAARARLREIEAALSRYDPESELSGLNRAAGGEAVRVSETTGRAIAEAKRLAHVTGGVFNPLVGNLLAVWAEAERREELPREDELEAALDLLDTGAVRLERAGEGWTCRLARPGMKLDLGGMAKGWAADEALAAARQVPGVRAVLVNLGGDGACWSGPGWARRWTFGVQDPRDPEGRSVLRRLSVSTGAVVTSGNYYRGYEIGGTPYNHVLDPRTGRPAATGAVSATVVPSRGADADALATACLVLEPEAALALLERIPEAEGLVLEESGGRLLHRATSGLIRYKGERARKPGPARGAALSAIEGPGFGLDSAGGRAKVRAARPLHVGRAKMEVVSDECKETTRIP